MNRSTGEALIQLLEQYGIDCAFGIPGVHNVELYRALPNARLRHVLGRHEQNVCFMADGYARATARAAACFTITGPGLTNALTAIAEAYTDSVPMLVFSSGLRIPDLGLQGGRLHEMIDQRRAADAVTDLTFRATSSAQIPEIIARALGAIRSGRPRPAYIEIPIDVLEMPAAGRWQAHELPGLPGPDPKLVERAAELLKRSQSPIIIAGGGARECGASLQSLAERLDAPVLTTIAGRGLLPASHPLSLGSVLPQEAAHALIASSDVVLAVGTELSPTDTARTLVLHGKLIRIDIAPDALSAPFSAAVPLLADANPAIEAISERLGPREEPTGAKRGPQRVATVLASVGENETPQHRGFARILSVVRAALPEDTIITSDETQLVYYANEAFPIDRPASWLHPVGFGTLGYALPAAIGAKVGCPSRPVAVLTGDFGFQYTCQELATASELGLPIPVLLYNSNSLAQIHDTMVRRRIEPNAVTLVNPDFQKLAEGFNCHARRLVSLAELADAIDRALQSDRPTLIEIGPGIEET